MGDEADARVEQQMSLPECKHGLIRDWCAICNRHKLPEEEVETLTFKGLLKGIK